jgi:hypothetical protein
VAIEEQRLRVRRSLEELLGVEEASYLMDRPAGGWSELVTNHTLDLKVAVLDARMDAMEHRILGEIDRRFAGLAWQLLGAVIAGMAVMGGVFAGLVALIGA